MCKKMQTEKILCNIVTKKRRLTLMFMAFSQEFFRESVGIFYYFFGFLIKGTYTCVFERQGPGYFLSRPETPCWYPSIRFHHRFFLFFSGLRRQAEIFQCLYNNFHWIQRLQESHANNGNRFTETLFLQNIIFVRIYLLIINE